MKLSQFKTLIREEVRKVLKESEYSMQFTANKTCLFNLGKWYSKLVAMPDPADSTYETYAEIAVEEHHEEHTVYVPYRTADWKSGWNIDMSNTAIAKLSIQALDSIDESKKIVVKCVYPDGIIKVPAYKTAVSGVLVVAPGAERNKVIQKSYE